MPGPRDALYDRLIDVLGVDHANTMMRYLPDDQPATRQDLSETRSDLRAEIADVKTELRAEIGDVKTELRAEIVEVRSELRDFRAEMRQEIRSLHDLFAAQTRTIVVTSFGSALTVATLVFIAAQIV